jgi:hypothetical protein
VKMALVTSMEEIIGQLFIFRTAYRLQCSAALTSYR